MPQEHVLPIVGDVAAIDEANVTRKGGSLTATIRKSVRAGLGDVSDHLAAAALQFAAGPSLVLLSGFGAAASAVRVRRLGGDSFEIKLDTGEPAEVDDLTAAFLRLKVEQFKRGELRLSPPVDAEGWRREMADKADRTRGCGAQGA